MRLTSTYDPQREQFHGHKQPFVKNDLGLLGCSDIQALQPMKRSRLADLGVFRDAIPGIVRGKQHRAAEQGPLLGPNR